MRKLTGISADELAEGLLQRAIARTCRDKIEGELQVQPELAKFGVTVIIHPHDVSSNVLVFGLSSTLLDGGAGLARCTRLLRAAVETLETADVELEVEGHDA